MSMKNRFKLIFVSLFFLVFFFSFISSVKADGCILQYDPVLANWVPGRETQQTAYIYYHNGTESMNLVVNTDLLNTSAVWIFPIPASPNKIIFNVSSAVPTLFGSEIGYDGINNYFSDLPLIALISQVYAIPIVVYILNEPKVSYSQSSNVMINRHVEKMGLTTELITANDESSFYNYLADKNLSLPLNSKEILNYYIGKNYSFVVSWISNATQFSKDANRRKVLHLNMSMLNSRHFHGAYVYSMSIQVLFPTDKIYFPLKLTSIYSDEEIPIEIYVIGWVNPDIYPSIKNATQVDFSYGWCEFGYHHNSSFFFDKNPGEMVDNLTYTLIRINTPSKYLTQDLWIKNSQPFRLKFELFIIKLIVNFLLLWHIILFIIFSCLSSLFAGLIAFRRYKPNKVKLALFGLWNLLTLIGVIIATLFLKPENLNQEFNFREDKTRRWDSRKTSFVILFTLLFIGLNFAFMFFINLIF